jgi:hypothetical protein
MLDLLFANNHAQIDQKTLPRLRISQAPNKKKKIVAHPTGHSNTHLSPAQQPTNNPRH